MNKTKQNKKATDGRRPVCIPASFIELHPGRPSPSPQGSSGSFAPAVLLLFNVIQLILQEPVLLSELLSFQAYVFHFPQLLLVTHKIMFFRKHKRRHYLLTKAMTRRKGTSLLSFSSAHNTALDDAG